jgi:hypothetical protein
VFDSVHNHLGWSAGGIPFHRTVPEHDKAPAQEVSQRQRSPAALSAAPRRGRGRWRPSSGNMDANTNEEGPDIAGPFSVRVR